DFTTAARIVEALTKELGAGTVSATDAGAVKVKVPADLKASPTMLLSKINDIDVAPASPSRVVINERTGT
ncbi:flagellar basal body P-ring protein FlgI, partial [Clostridioides difficile]|uniref:flagellar basal body P-ring protein FlgI n=1 Tax=Clostridioides difficile TaxID=1496 RepID=UPI0018DB701F